MPDPSLNDYTAMFDDLMCRLCYHPLNGRLKHYQHQEGWMVADFEMPQWLLMQCQGCGYHWNVGHIEILKTSTARYKKKIEELRQELKDAGFNPEGGT